MDWIEEDGLTRMVEIDHEMESDDYDRIDDEPYAGSKCVVEGDCKADPDARSMISNSVFLLYEVLKNLPAEDCEFSATYFFEKCSNTEDMPITATYTDKNGKSSIYKANKKFANPNL